MNTPHQHQLPKVTYLSRWLRWPIAIAVGILMVYLSEPDSWYDLHLFDGYILAMLTSCLVSIALTKMVNYVSIWLDKRMSWVLRPAIRLTLQLSLGVLIPIALAIAGMSYYFSRYGLSLNQTTYFDRVFIPLCLFITMANAYYPLHFFVELYRQHKKQQKSEAGNQPTISDNPLQENLRVAKTTKLAALALPENYKINDLMLLISIDRNLYSYSLAGEKMQWHHPIEISSKLLPETLFFKINKSAIVHRDNIVKAQHCSSNCIELTLRIPNNYLVRVSQRNRSNFVVWYAKTILTAVQKN